MHRFATPMRHNRLMQAAIVRYSLPNQCRAFACELWKVARDENCVCTDQPSESRTLRRSAKADAHYQARTTTLCRRAAPSTLYTPVAGSLGWVDQTGQRTAQ